jgi:hypothetical protein
MSVQSLAKSVILQSIDDLYDKRYSADSLRFFSSRDFTVVSELAGLNSDEQLRLLNMVRKISGHFKKKKTYRKSFKAGRVKPSPQSLPAPSHSHL